MNILKNERLGRRTVLRGIGATLSLPFLEAMIPARAAASSVAAGSSSNGIPARMAMFYFGTGMNMREFEPVDAGKNFTLSPILKPLAKFRDDMTILSGTYLEHGGGHGGDYTFSTGVQARRNGGIYNSVSADQIVAEQVGSDTRFPSLQMSVKRGTGYGGNLRTISWNRNGIPLASESDPHVIFNKLFRSESPEEKAANQQDFVRRHSILDAILGDAKALNAKVSSADQEKLDEYFQSIREVELQLERNEAWATKPKPEVKTKGMGNFNKSYDPEDTRDFQYEPYSDMMYDLISLAFQTDSTRVISYVVRQELAGGVYPEFGVSKGYHSLSHHNNEEKNLRELAKVDTFYMEYWAHLLDRLKSIKEVDGSPLLDHCMLGFSSGMGIGHSKDRLPTALFGGKALGIQHQGHLELPPMTPLSNLWRTMIDRMGADPGNDFQDSTGVIKELTA